MSEKSEALASDRLKLGRSHWIETPSKESREGVRDGGSSGEEKTCETWEKGEEKGPGEEGKGVADRSEHLVRESFTKGLGLGFKRGRLRRWKPPAAEVRSRTEAAMADGEMARNGRNCDLTNTKRGVCLIALILTNNRKNVGEI